MTIFEAISLLKNSDDVRIAQWIRSLSEDDVVKLLESKHASIQEKPVDAGYIDYLKEQIRLSPRGPLWANILQDRVNALTDFIGTPVVFVCITSDSEYLFARIDPRNNNIIHLESG